MSFGDHNVWRSVEVTFGGHSVWRSVEVTFGGHSMWRFVEVSFGESERVEVCKGELWGVRACGGL